MTDNRTSLHELAQSESACIRNLQGQLWQAECDNDHEESQRIKDQLGAKDSVMALVIYGLPAIAGLRSHEKPAARAVGHLGAAVLAAGEVTRDLYRHIS